MSSSTTTWAPPARFGQQQARLGVRGKSQRNLRPLNQFTRAQSHVPTRGGETFTVANDEKCDCGRGLADQLRKHRQGQQQEQKSNSSASAQSKKSEKSEKQRDGQGQRDSKKQLSNRSKSAQSKKSKKSEKSQSRKLDALAPQKIWNTVQHELEASQKKSEKLLKEVRRSLTPKARSVEKKKPSVGLKSPLVKTPSNKSSRSESISKSKRRDGLVSERNKKDVCKSCCEKKRKFGWDSRKPLISKLSSTPANKSLSIKTVKSAPSLKQAKTDDGSMCKSCREQKQKKNESVSKKPLRSPNRHPSIKTPSQAKLVDVQSYKSRRDDKTKTRQCLLYKNEQKSNRSESAKHTEKVRSRDSKVCPYLFDRRLKKEPSLPNTDQVKWFN